MNRMIIFLIVILFSFSVYAELSDPTQPTQPTFFGDGADGSLELNAILYSKSNPVAIIGGNIVKQNDMVRGYKVTAIQKLTVTLTGSDGEVKTLKIDSLDVKKPHQF